MTDSPCQCPLAGYCATHGREMSAVKHRLCRDKPGYFEAFAKSAGREKHGPPRPQKERQAARPRLSGAGCVHRGERVSTIGCASCGGSVEVPIYECKLYGECADRARIEDVTDCGRCPDNSTAPSPHPPTP